MKLGILSDTHFHSIDELPPDILEVLANVDIIIHAGDFTALPILEGLKEIGNVVAVQGNMDSEAIKSILPRKQILEVGNRKLGIIHGWGSPLGIKKRVGEEFDAVDVIIFGHSHQPANETIGGVLFFNPGEARNTFGILEIDEETRGQILPVSC